MPRFPAKKKPEAPEELSIPSRHWATEDPTDEDGVPDFAGVRARLWRGLKRATSEAWNPREAMYLTAALRNLWLLQYPGDE
jgi:hypothetical protein